MDNIGRLLDGRETTFEVPNAGTYRLDVGWVFAPGTPNHQTLELALDARPLGRVRVERPCSLAFFVPEEGTLHVMLPDAARPIDVGAGPDTRTLSVGFSGFHSSLEFSVFEGVRVRELASNALLTEFGMTRQHVASQVESLGDNCELGMVQREFGIEPLGLFRFSSTTPEALIRALEGRLAGLGDPGTLSLSLLGDRREYMVHDSLYGLLYHTWLFADDVSEEQILAREHMHLPFLTRMFLEKAKEGGMVYVYRDHGRMPEVQAERMLAALRGFGSNDLLVVRQADVGHEADTFLASPNKPAYAWIDYKGPDWWMIGETWVNTLITATQLRAKVLPSGYRRDTMAR